jgi:hypothetical protein
MVIASRIKHLMSIRDVVRAIGGYPECMIRRLLVVACCLLAAATGTIHAARHAPPSPIFRFDTDDFWLDLHQFLYVLGRDVSQQPDRLRRAVAQAPKESADVMASATPDEKRAMIAAIAGYAAGPSKLDAIFDKTLVDAATALAAVRSDATSLAGVAIPADIRALLEMAGPAYRARFWPAHRAANAKWVAAMQPLLDQYGGKVHAFIMAKYALPWPADGYTVHVVAYANWAGAFSTGDRILLISSLDAGNAGTSALETVFHESMHQWDEPIEAAIVAAARAQGRTAPANLNHAMIFYTAGEAVRRVVPGHLPYAEANGLWARMAPLKPLLDQAWLPYLNGAGTRDEAIAALIRAANPSYLPYQSNLSYPSARIP